MRAIDEEYADCFVKQVQNPQMTFEEIKFNNGRANGILSIKHMLESVYESIDDYIQTITEGN